MKVWTDEPSGRVQWLREKHYGRKVAQQGYSPSAKSGNGTKKRNKKKLSDAMKKVMYASQPKMIMVVSSSGKTKMVRVDMLA